MLSHDIHRPLSRDKRLILAILLSLAVHACLVWWWRAPAIPSSPAEQTLLQAELRPGTVLSEAISTEAEPVSELPHKPVTRQQTPRPSVPVAPGQTHSQQVMTPGGLDMENLRNQIRANDLAGGSEASPGPGGDAGRNRQFAGGRAGDLRYQAYLDSVSKKLERIGFSLFPTNQYGKKVYGQVTVAFTIGKDGQLLKFQIKRSSGKADLDKGVERIFQAAQPFARFPDNIAAETDTIPLTKTIAFIDGNRAMVY